MKCKHGVGLDVSCDECWNKPNCRKCGRDLKQGELAWWCPGPGPQCAPCRKDVPTHEQAMANLRKTREAIERLLGDLDKHIKKEKKK